MVNQSFFRKICLIFKINCVNIKISKRLQNCQILAITTSEQYETKQNPDCLNFRASRQHLLFTVEKWKETLLFN